MADSPEEIQKHLKAYTAVGVTLLIFTCVTVWIATVDLGSDFVNVTVGLLIATFKAGLVAAIFMHLNSEKVLIYRILLFTAFYAAAGMVLFIIALHDPITLN
ncbi:MAG: cytochrome C oxidase subunit IV family protein [Verrucomicrobiota bacterium]